MPWEYAQGVIFLGVAALEKRLRVADHAAQGVEHKVVTPHVRPANAAAEDGVLVAFEPVHERCGNARRATYAPAAVHYDHVDMIVVPPRPP